jgi:glycosyltransferase involved in cell wall biosynthesis
VKVWIVGHAYVAELAHGKLQALAELPGIDLTLLVPTAWRTALGLVPLTAPPAPPYRIVASRLAQNGRIGAHLYRDGILALRRARPDIVQAEVEPWSVAALQCALAAPAARLVIFTWENLEPALRRTSRAIERFVLRRAALVIAGSEAARRRIMRRGVGRDRIAVLPQLGVDPDRYAKRDRDVARARLGLTAPVIGYIGRLVPEKGVDVLVEAMAPLDARLLVVGNGASRGALEARVSSWPRDKARFVGAVTDTDVPEYLAALDALVLPSRTTTTWAEQFGHVLIEAMAAGVPVIGSSSGAIPEVVGDAGVIVPEGDAVALRGALERVLADPAHRARLCERGWDRVQTRYTHAVVARELASLYRRLVGA